MSLALVAATLALLQQSSATEHPRAVAAAAVAAVERDSGAAALARWSARVARDSGDRAALLGLAALARLTYAYPAAERALQRLLGREPAEPDAFAAYAHLDLARGLAARARLAAAAESFERAITVARAVGDGTAELDGWIGLATMRGRTVGYAAAETTFARAAPLLGSAEPSQQAEYRCARAGFLIQAGRPEAKDEAMAGAEQARAAGSRRVHALCLLQIARDQHRLGGVDSALRLLGAAEREQRRARDRGGLATTLEWRGNLLMTIGEYGLARRALRDAITEGRASGDDSPVAFGHLLLAMIALHFGDASTGSTLAAKAETLFNAQGNERGVATLRATQGDLARLTGRTSAARVAYEDAARRGERFGAWASVSPHRHLAGLSRREGDWLSAERALITAAAKAREHRLRAWEERLGYDFAAVALARGDLPDAERKLRAYLETLDRNEQGRRYVARARLAELYARRGDAARAEAELAAATDALDDWRALLDDRELRVSVFQARQDEDDPDLGVATVIAALAARGRSAPAFELAERRRARELLDDLVRLQALRTDSSTLRGAVAAMRAAPRRWRAEQIAAAIPDDNTAILEFVTGRGGEPTTVFLLTRAGIRASAVAPVDSMTADVERFVALVEGGAEARALGRKLAAQLLDSALAAMPPAVTRLVVVPDDVLHRLPLDALSLPDGRLIVERFAVSLAPSAAIAADLWGRKPAEREARLLALADPDFGIVDRASDAAESYASAFSEHGGLPRLAASEREARLAGRYASRVEVRLREQASEAYLKQTALEPFRIVHFATHALVDERAVTRTALALAPGGGEDGFLGPNEIANLRLEADVVILSACRTAGGVVVGGEGIRGLTAPLLQAGARSVVATTWAIDDHRAVGLVGDFYAALAGGSPVTEALRTAKIRALRMGAPPSDWAAFTLVGDPLVRVPLAAHTRFRTWWLLAALAVIPLGYGVRALKVRRVAGS